MKRLLTKLRLIEYLKMEIDVSRNEFSARLKAAVDDAEIGMFSYPFEAFASGKKEYRGHVGLDQFKIKRRRSLFDMNINHVIAQGTFKQNENRLVIETEVNGFNALMIPFYVVALLVYLLFLIADGFKGQGFFLFPFLMIHAAFMLGVPYLMMRRSVQKLKYEQEHEFFYIAKR